MTKNCKECTDKTLEDYADLHLKYERALQHIVILNNCLDTKEELCNFYRNEYELLKEKMFRGKE